VSRYLLFFNIFTFLLIVSPFLCCSAQSNILKIFIDLLKFSFICSLNYPWHHDIQHNDIQHDTQHNNTLNATFSIMNDTQHCGAFAVMLSAIYAECFLCGGTALHWPTLGFSWHLGSSLHCSTGDRRGLGTTLL
jgi:hypothetical protein